jgi:hypothetical protein
MQAKAISLKNTLQGEIVEFLDKEGMSCIHTQNGLLGLVNAIAQYKEEGVYSVEVDPSVPGMLTPLFD